jgi:hypothetical protein
MTGAAAAGVRVRRRQKEPEGARVKIQWGLGQDQKEDTMSVGRELRRRRSSRQRNPDESSVQWVENRVNTLMHTEGEG